MDNIVVLNDNDGNELEFEYLDLIEHNEETYVVLLPVDEEALLNDLFEIFKEKNADKFDFD